MKNVLTVTIILISSILLSAQSIFDIGLKEVNTGEVVLLKDYQSSKGLVIVFMSVKCPYAKYYEDRLGEIASEYQAKGVTFLIVNSNSSESIDMMKIQAEVLDVAYLIDSSKELANLIGAKKSPEAYVVMSDGDVYYSGAIDDNPQVASDVRASYLKEAIVGLLEGEKSATNSTNRPVGCMIK